jgi:hypothetical protein
VTNTAKFAASGAVQGITTAGGAGLKATKKIAKETGLKKVYKTVKGSTPGKLKRIMGGEEMEHIEEEY